MSVTRLKIFHVKGRGKTGPISIFATYLPSNSGERCEDWSIDCHGCATQDGPSEIMTFLGVLSSTYFTGEVPSSDGGDGGVNEVSEWKSVLVE